MSDQVSELVVDREPWSRTSSIYYICIIICSQYVHYIFIIISLSLYIYIIIFLLYSFNYSLTKVACGFIGFLFSFLKAALCAPPRLVHPRPPHWFPQIPKIIMVPPDFKIYPDLFRVFFTVLSEVTL